MEIQLAVAKIPKYDQPDSGDSLEVIERPNGGFSVVLAEAVQDNKPNHAISAEVVRKVITWLGEGVRDGAAARAASDALFAQYNGKVTAGLSILSADLQTRTLVLARNTSVPAFLLSPTKIDTISGAGIPAGSARNVRPSIIEIPIEISLTMIICTDGIQKAGQKYGNAIDFHTLLESLTEELEPTPQELADSLLANAIRLDEDHPADDMSVVVLQILPRRGDISRRMNIRFPVLPDW